MAKIERPTFAVELPAGAPAMRVTATNADLVAFDLTRAKHSWPSMRDAPFLWQTFVAWHALRRTGRLASDGKPLTFDAFRDTAEVEADPDESEEADPTQ